MGPEGPSYIQTFTPEQNAKYSPIAAKVALIATKTIAIATAVVLQPEVGIPMAVAEITGVPVTPAPQAWAGPLSSSVKASLTTEASNAKSFSLLQPADLPNNALVARGGLCKSENFASGTGVTIDANGKMSGVSVGSQQGASTETLSSYFPNTKVGTTTVGQIREAGGSVVPSPTSGNPTHATLSGISSVQAEELFNPVIFNPNKTETQVKIPFKAE